MRELLEKWNVRRLYRAAYRPQGNGIVERHHRTIKRVAERSGISPIEAVFWYNMSPKKGLQEETVPAGSVAPYKWRHPLVAHEDGSGGGEQAKLQVGDEVWVKPPQGKCTTHWSKGRVTKVNTKNNVSVDGTPRHILDVRPVVPPLEDEESSDEEVNEEEEEEAEDDNPQDPPVVETAPVRGRPTRRRRAPTWTVDYQMGLGSSDSSD